MQNDWLVQGFLEYIWRLLGKFQLWMETYYGVVLQSPASIFICLPGRHWNQVHWVKMWLCSLDELMETALRIHDLKTHDSASPSKPESAPAVTVAQKQLTIAHWQLFALAALIQFFYLLRIWDLLRMLVVAYTRAWVIDLRMRCCSQIVYNWIQLGEDFLGIDHTQIDSETPGFRNHSIQYSIHFSSFPHLQSYSWVTPFKATA